MMNMSSKPLRALIAVAAAGAVAAACTTTANRPPAVAAEAPDGAIRATPMTSAPLDLRTPLTRIVFASCMEQKGPQDIWSRLAAEKAGLVLLLGDNVYGDVRSADPALPELKAAYMRLAESAPFAALRAKTPVLAVWDDHDYGLNDAGAEFALRKQSEALFEHVWALPPDDPRRKRDGVYGSFVLGPEGRRVQVILLDTRSFRSPLKQTDERDAPGKERYIPDADPAKTMLGEAQWAWLAEELKRPAELRIIASSVQVLADGHGWEAWRQLPSERARLFQTIRETRARNVVIVSGDRHLGALYRESGLLTDPLVEATASSLNLPQSTRRAAGGDTRIEPGANRMGDPVYDVNYGVIEIDWSRATVGAAIKGAAGETLRTTTLAIAPPAP